MNYQEAREIVDKTPFEFNAAQPRVLYFEAKAYLEAHAKAENLVKALENLYEALPAGSDTCETISCEGPGRGSITNGPNVTSGFQKAIGLAKQALSEWRQSNGVEKP